MMKTNQNNSAFLKKQSQQNEQLKIEKKDYKMMCMCWF